MSTLRRLSQHPRKRGVLGRMIESGYGNNCSPVSASSTKIALTGQLSAAIGEPVAG